jgi:hypothetical protein
MNRRRPKEELKARKAGFRTLSKERREVLQTEYVEYRDALMRRIATSAPPDNAPESPSNPPEKPGS